MAHFYNIKDNTFNEDVTTPAQARKHGSAVPSVTTVLGVIKEAFIHDIYRPRKITELARKHPNMDWRDVSDLVYGQRKHPTTNELIPSSEFGTEVHKRLQELVECLMDGKEPEDRSIWDDWARPFMGWLKEKDVTPYCAERIVSCDKVKIAGSVDFIGRWPNGNFFLADYKCRSCNNDIPKFYDKDCAQLAIESYFLKQELELDHLPECISVCIDTDSAKHHHKMWKAKEVQSGIRVAKLCAKLYWETRM